MLKWIPLQLRSVIDLVMFVYCMLIRYVMFVPNNLRIFSMFMECLMLLVISSIVLVNNVYRYNSFITKDMFSSFFNLYLYA